MPVAALAPQPRADSTSALTELVDAAAQRLQVAEPVAAVKWSAHGAIEDPGRVEQELAKVGAEAEATARHIDPNYVTRVFGDQINATEGIEYSRFADWKLNPSNVPPASPDLSASRSAIDALNQTMLTQIVANWDLLPCPRAPCSSTPPEAVSSGRANSTAFINRRCHWRRAHIARADLLISHQFLKLSFGFSITDLC